MSIYLLSVSSKESIEESIILLPMIKFSLLEVNIDLSHCDILMFTSKQAVKSVDTLNKNWKKIPCLAIGKSTAKTIEALGGTVLHQPSSFYGKALVQDIIEKFKDKNILYLRPKIVSFDSKSFLAKAGIHLQEQIIYETSCVEYKPKDKPEKNAIIIFTSPSTIHCFLKNFDWDESYTAVVIGYSTKEHLPINSKCEVSNKPLMDACIVKAKQILLSSNFK